MIYHIFRSAIGVEILIEQKVNNLDVCKRFCLKKKEDTREYILYFFIHYTIVNSNPIPLLFQTMP